MTDYQDFIKEKIRLIKENPGQIFGLLYPYIFLILLAIGLVYSSKLGEIAQQATPPPLPDTTGQKQLEILEPRNVAAVDVMQLSQPSAEMVAKGNALYSANCASCHGINGKGDGPASQGLNPPPRNYTIKTGWVNGQKISEIYETLEHGIVGSAMKPFDYLSPEDKFALAQYIRQTFVPNPPADSKSDLQNLDQTYNLSKERRLPGQIPVNVAMDLIIKESSGRMNKVKETIQAISKDSVQGAVIFKKVVKNPELALTSLVNASYWKQDKSRFIDLVINDFNQDGFNDNIFLLNDSQWTTLYNYMNKYF